MAHVRVEMDRGGGWEVRQDGHADVTVDALAALMPAYSVAYPHRAFIEGCLFVSSERRRNGRVVVTRHDV